MKIKTKWDIPSLPHFLSKEPRPSFPLSGLLLAPSTRQFLVSPQAALLGRGWLAGKGCAPSGPPGPAASVGLSVRDRGVR